MDLSKWVPKVEVVEVVVGDFTMANTAIDELLPRLITVCFSGIGEARGRNVSINVSQDIMCCKSAFFRQLFSDDFEPTQKITLEENDPDKACQLIKMIHDNAFSSPLATKTFVADNSWDSTFAKLSCKWIVDDYVLAFNEIAKQRFKHIVAESVFLSTTSQGTRVKQLLDRDVFGGKIKPPSSVREVRQSQSGHARHHFQPASDDLSPIIAIVKSDSIKTFWSIVDASLTHLPLQFE